jgi:hypothetical protein
MCYGLGYTDGPKHCAEPCKADADCDDLQGIDFTCSAIDGACRVDCSKEGTNGLCPSPLQCVMTPLDGLWRCRLTKGPAAGTRAAFEACDPSRGNTDCQEGLVCYLASGSKLGGAGYCTTSCNVASPIPCVDLLNAPAFLECGEGVCRYNCSEGECPDGMVCEPLDGKGLCHSGSP